MQNAHSNTTGPMTSPVRLTSSALLLAPPSEDAGVCVVCEDECTCGAAKTTVSSTKKLVSVLPLPPTKHEFDDDTDVSSLPPDANPSRNLDSKKKRGRPSKPYALAHETPPKGPSASQPNMTPQNSNSKSTFSKSSRITKKGASINNKSLSRPPGKIANSRLLAAATFASDGDDDDEFSDNSTHFPTFLPASILGSDLSSDDSDSLSSEDVDSALEAEEEELIMAEETVAMRKLRTHRETAANMEESIPDTGRRWDKMNWNSRERQASVSGSVVNDVGSDRSSDEGDSEEGDDDDDEDEDIDVDVFPAPIHDWSEVEEEYDADVFFANLSDSSFGSSSDSEPNLPTVNHHSAMDIQSDLDPRSLLEATEAGILSPDSEQLRHHSRLPLVVTEDWDGQLIFAHGMKDGEGAADVHFDTNARNTHGNDTDTGEADGEDTGTESETEDIEAEGNTTEEDEPTPGRPAPPLEPIPPLSPAGSSSVLGLPPTLSATNSATSPVPSDAVTTPKATNNTAPPPKILLPSLSFSTSQSSATSKTSLIMGSFAISAMESGCSAIIDGLREVFIPSPYSRVKKQRDGWRGKKRSASKQVSNEGHSNFRPAVFTSRLLGKQSDISPAAKRPRQSSLPDTTTRPQTTGSKRRLSNASDEAHVQSSPELPPPQPVELDDVLNAALLGNNSEEDCDAFASLVPSSGFFANLTRWDRVPISTFRRLRTAAAFDAGSSPGHSSTGALDSPRLADGFSYGSTSASVRAVSPFTGVSLGAALWESNAASPSSKRKGTGREMGHNSGPGSGRGRSKKRKVLISPVIFPVKDDIANLSGSQTFLLSAHEGGTTSKRQRRDKKTMGLFDSALNSPPSKLPSLPDASVLSVYQ
jgi:hypothetical protein